MSRPSCARSAGTTIGGMSTSIRAPVSSIAAERSPSASSTSARRSSGSRRVSLPVTREKVRRFWTIRRARTAEFWMTEVARAMSSGSDRAIAFVEQVGVDRDLAQGLLQIVRGDIGELGQPFVGDFEVGGASGELLFGLRRPVMSTMVASAIGPNSASIGVSAISTGNSASVLARPVQIAPGAHRPRAWTGEEPPAHAGMRRRATASGTRMSIDCPISPRSWRSRTSARSRRWRTRSRPSASTMIMAAGDASTASRKRSSPCAFGRHGLASLQPLAAVTGASGKPARTPPAT